MLLGVRSSDAGFDAVLRRALAAHVVEAVDAPPNYSCQVGELGDHGRRGFHFLHRGSSSVLRARSTRRLLRGLVTHLSSHAAPPADLFELNCVALSGPHGAVLAPPALRQWLDVIERRLQAGGLQVVDAPSIWLDPAHAEVVVPHSALVVDWAALDDLDTADEPAVSAGRYPLRGWAFFVDRADGQALGRGQAVALATQLTRNVEAIGLQRTLDGVAAIMRTIEPAALVSSRPADVVAPLVALS